MGYCLCRAPDEIRGTFFPILVYWVYSGICLALGRKGKFRLHTRQEEDGKNLASRRQVVVGVLVHQAAHVVLSIYFFKALKRCRAKAAADCAAAAAMPGFALAGRFLVAMVVLDTWQYFVHRLLHANGFLYRYSHAKHHRLAVPYAFGALYYHTPEGLLLNTVGGFVSVVVSGMSSLAAVFFLSLVSVKTVDIHSGLWIPRHPLNLLLGNNAAYHAVHHREDAGDFNFSQPFFVFWDKILGTHMPYTVVKREDGGFDLDIIKIAAAEEEKDKKVM